MASFRHIQTFAVDTSATARLIDMSEAMALASAKTSGYVQVIIATEESSLVCKFGKSDVMASDSLTDDAYPLGNYFCLAGTVQDLNIDKGLTHASVKATGAGSVKISIGYEV